MNPLKTIWEGLRTTTAGLRVTIPYIWKKPVTTQYPHQRLELPERTRNRLYVNMDDCIGCDQCARACPVNCIEIETVKAVGDDTPGTTSQGKKKALWVTKFDIDIAKCCYCGLCVYPCPTECIWMTDVFEFAETERRDLIYNFVTLTPEEIAEKREMAAKSETKPVKQAAPVEARAAPTATPASAPVAGDDDKAAKLAEIQRKMAEAKARRETGESGAAGVAAKPAEAGKAGADISDDDKAAKLAEIHRKMAEAKAKREAGEHDRGAEAAKPASPADDASADDKAAKIAELQRKMAEAKAKREAGGHDRGAEAAKPASPADDASADDRAARIAELQRKMAEAKARREAGETSEPAPAESPGASAAGSTVGEATPAESNSEKPITDVNEDEKAAKIAELKRKMAEAKARREAGEQSSDNVA